VRAGDDINAAIDQTIIDQTMMERVGESTE
jgi:hypothetical protein